MLSARDNERITKVGPGTPMGKLMRRYWQPVLLSWEVEKPDGDPVRVRILGEDLVAFRDTSGRVGLVGEWCPHRLTSLFLGRNEQNGIRCVYHGWKFDVSGACVDMPNEPEEFDFKHKVKMTAYPTVEMGGVVWAYMGPKDKQPPAPKFEFTEQPESHRGATKVIQESNWLQGLEGGIDSVHSSFLHRKFGNAGSFGFGGLRASATSSKLDVEPTAYGYRYSSTRPLPDGKNNYVRAYHWVMPHVQIRANQLTPDGKPEKFKIAGHHWVPIDDHNTMVWNWLYSLDKPLTHDEQMEKGYGNGPEAVDQATFRPFANIRNNWLMSREVQRTDTFTGIEGINQQDRAVQESMGPVVPRWQEHLGQTDRAIITARKMLLRAIDIVEDGGDPPGADDSYYGLRAIEEVLPKELFGLDALARKMYAGAGA